MNSHWRNLISSLPVRGNAQIKLSTRIFVVVFTFYFVMNLASNLSIYLIASQFSRNQAKSYLAAVVQYNAESIDKSLLKIFELLIYPAYNQTLYEKITLHDPDFGREIDAILLRKDLLRIFAQNTYVPLRTTFPTADYRFAVNSQLPSAANFADASDLRLLTTDRVADESWMPNDGAIKITADLRTNQIIFSRRIIFNDAGKRVFLGVLAIWVNVYDLTLAQNEHPVTAGNLFYLRTDDDLVLPITRGGQPVDSATLSSFSYVNNKTGAVDRRINGLRYLVQPVRLNAGWELIGLIPYSTIRQSWLPLLLWILLINLVVIAMLLFLTRTFIPRAISSPITRLADTISEVVQQNDFTRILPAESSSAELFTLYDAYNKLMHHVAELIENIYVENENAKRSEILALQAQINPHFLYNTLDSIGWTFMKENDKVASILSSLSSILRYSIQDANRLVRFCDEVEIIREYINIQEFCYSLSVQLDITDENMDDIYLPKLTLQPLVENAVLHGIREVQGLDSRISISARTLDGFIEVNLTNNGKSPDIDELERITTMDPIAGKHGLNNVNRRLVIRYGPESRLHYAIPKGGGLSITFRIPA